ncbi:BSD domain containing protein [Fagus crenata]
MDLSSWFRRTTKKSTKNPNPPKPQGQQEQEQEQEEQLLGVTEQLIDFVKSFTFDTFKNFHLQDNEDETPTTSGNVRNDLSEWQERHATLVLSQIKEISQLRYMLCPRHLKESQFWRIYFKLVKSHVAEYELCAVQVAKLKRMALENEKSSDSSPCEVEMAEAKHAEHLAPPSP